MAVMGIGRKPCRTTKGYIGWVPSRAKSGDQVCIIAHGAVPFIIRPNEEDGCYKLIGESYIHGVMIGEYLEQTYVLFKMGKLPGRDGEGVKFAQVVSADILFN
jgi:hypothetical protein